MVTTETARETSRLIAADKVEGTSVYNLEGDKLGTVHNVMIDKFTGRVAYAEMSFGGFLGIGDKYHALPWETLKYDHAQGGYVVDIDRDRLEKAPVYAADKPFNWEDEKWGRKVHDYYGVRPYWE